MIESLIPTGLLPSEEKEAHKARVAAELTAKHPLLKTDFITRVRNDQLLCRVRPPQVKASGRIFSPQGYETLQNEGEVLAVGPDVKDLAPGDYVVWVQGAGMDRVKLVGNGPEFRIIGQLNILAVLDNQARETFLADTLDTDATAEKAAGGSIAAVREELKVKL